MRTLGTTTDAGPVDVVVRVTGVGSYDAHVSGAENREVFGIEIRVASLVDLIASKEATRRPRDEAILRELRDLRDKGNV